MRISLLTYATENFLKNAEALACNVKSVGFNSAKVITPADIKESEFYRRNTKILEQPRGAGFWLWKPYIILEAVKRLDPDEVLFYCDAGRTNYYHFSRYPDKLLEKVCNTSSGFLLGPPQSHLGNVRSWTKRDCLILMGVDREPYLGKSLLMTWSLWRHTSQAIEFLEEWLHFCEDERCLTDIENSCGKPNYPEYRDHRHDMSVLSLLAYKTKAPYLDFTQTLTHRLLNFRPYSGLAQNFYKRPENAEILLRRDNPLMLGQEFFRLMRAIA